MASLHENMTSTVSGLSEDAHIVGALDQLIASGLRLWMLLAMIFGILLLMMIIICCFIKIRIPRTKREIELDAALRKKKKICNAAEIQSLQSRNRGSAKVIVMSSLPAASQSLLSPSSGLDADLDSSSLKLHDGDEDRRQTDRV